jgi:hypothetical protein
VETLRRVGVWRIRSDPIADRSRYSGWLELIGIPRSSVTTAVLERSGDTRRLLDLSSDLMRFAWPTFPADWPRAETGNARRPSAPTRRMEICLCIEINTVDMKGWTGPAYQRGDCRVSRAHIQAGPGRELNDRADCEEKAKLVALSYMYKPGRSGLDNVADGAFGTCVLLWTWRKGPAVAAEHCEFAPQLKRRQRV